MEERAELFVWDGSAIYIGEFTERESLHQHHAVQIVVGLEKDFQIYVDRTWSAYNTVLIAADTPHRIQGTGGRQLAVWLDDESKIARQLTEKYLRNHKIKSFSGPFFETVIYQLVQNDFMLYSCSEAKEIFDHVITVLLQGAARAAPPVDSRIKQSLQILDTLDIKKISLKEIARRSSLSESRFLHLFTQQIGIPFRRYLLWLRIREAIKMVVNENYSLTEAAHSTHFSDAAHLSRTFKRMFGRSISKTLKNSQFVQAVFCGN